MNLDELLRLVCASNRPIRIRTDSRQTQAGDVFVAVPGTVVDGHDFIDQAVAAGAGYIVSQRPVNRKDAEVIHVDNSAKAAAALAQAANGHPASKLTNLAVTGTNGKTTVAYLVRSVIQTAGERCGLIGTVTYETGAESSPAALTTPDCLTIAEAQSKMLKAGAKYMVIEASSHALAQNRLAGIGFRAAAFTNLAGDHLDYHKTPQDYLAAKAGLFELLRPDSVAVLNKQSPQAKQIAEKTKASILWYAVGAPADIRADIESTDLTETVFRLSCGASSRTVRTPLPGEYNVSNHLAAAGLSLAAGFDLETITAGLSALKTVPGRVEKLDFNGDFTVIVDYAHTGDALKNVLSALRGLCKGKLIVVFGCGGDRDKTKRPRMAAAAEQLADLVIVTSDNPRTEHPAAIIGEIAVGFKNPTADTISIEPDRERAIALAVNCASKGDIVLIAGKGHETCQIIGTDRIGFSDKDTALQYLRRLK